ncbi:MAG: hypothetical protein WDO74_27760 [Pseudomonadota bacterium]
MRSRLAAAAAAVTSGGGAGAASGSDAAAGSAGAGSGSGGGGDGCASARLDVKLAANSNDQERGTRMVATIARDPKTGNWLAMPRRCGDAASSKIDHLPQFIGDPRSSGSPSHKR